MRFLPTLAVATAFTLAVAVHADSDLPRERIKTGILPNGGFYTLYSVTCSDNRMAEVASTDRRQRWCARAGTELACFRSADAASSKACGAVRVASRQAGGDSAFTN